LAVVKAASNPDRDQLPRIVVVDPVEENGMPSPIWPITILSWQAIEDTGENEPQCMRADLYGIAPDRPTI
jgi:hypothetical protein